jgi:hypothetical protein
VERIIQKHGENFFFAYIIIAVVPLFIYEIEVDAPFIFAFNNLSVPILALAFYIYLAMMPEWRQKAGKVKGIGFTLMFAGLFIIMSGGYVILFNALVGTQQEQKIEGKVVKLDTSSSSESKTSYHVSVKNGITGRVIELTIPESTYSHLEVGHLYSQMWKVGSLGLLYK